MENGSYRCSTEIGCGETTQSLTSLSPLRAIRSWRAGAYSVQGVAAIKDDLRHIRGDNIRTITLQRFGLADPIHPDH